MTTPFSNNKEEQILVSITGQDRPGLTASIMGILARYEAQILDIDTERKRISLSIKACIDRPAEEPEAEAPAEEPAADAE